MTDLHTHQPPQPRYTGYVTCPDCQWPHIPSRPDDLRCNLCRVSQSVKKTVQREEQKRKTFAPRPCHQCGDMFKPRSANSKYCTKACRDRADLDARIRQYTKPCAICERPFITTDTRKVTCSSHCYRERRRRNQAARLKAREVTKQCVECGNDFTATSEKSRTVTCSEPCRTERTLKLRREQHARRQAKKRAAQKPKVQAAQEPKAEPLPRVDMVALKDQIPQWLKPKSSAEQRERLAEMMAEAERNQKGRAA